MLEENCISLAKYRMETSMETLNVARECLENKHFKDSINRAYYASFLLRFTCAPACPQRCGAAAFR